MLTRLVFWEYVIQAAAYSVAVYSNGQLLLQIFSAALHRQLSSNLIVNICFWLMTAVAGLVHSSYMCWSDLNGGPVFGPIMFWTGVVFHSTAATLSFSVTFLLMDRISALNTLTRYTAQHQRFLLLSILCSMAAGFSLFVVIVGMEDSPPAATVCPSFGCLLRRFPATFLAAPKTLAGLMSVCLSLVFWRKLAKHQQQYIGSQRHSRQVFLNCIPFVVWTILAAYGVDQWNYAGPYALVLFSLDALVTSLIYRTVIGRRSARTSKLGVSVAGSGPQAFPKSNSRD
ncbi:hypothetical protein M3Y99_00901700 [Aphelenchoides fujianensis]|nr:hypothetical protein M3Y99_00901700 [Aphelenchoides fujianensis]